MNVEDITPKITGCNPPFTYPERKDLMENNSGPETAAKDSRCSFESFERTEVKKMPLDIFTQRHLRLKWN